MPHEFKIIRYNGFYRKKHVLHDKIVMLINNEVKKLRRQLLKYELSILRYFKRNPFNCPKCQTRTEFLVCIT